MRTFVILLLGLFLLVPLGQGQTEERASTDAIESLAGDRGPGQSPGQCCWSRPAELITGDIRCLGVEFDDGPNGSNHYWVTGAYDFTVAHLYKIDQFGTLQAVYQQPVTNWGAWGWRDLAWDYKYLYAGDDTTMPGYITQISTITGQPTGVNFGPYPVVPCRALAYDSLNDCFWTASFGSSIYQCFKDGTFNTYVNPGLSIYGMAMDESIPNNPILWIWSQDGNGCLATEFDINTGTPTGTTFDGCVEIGGVAGGACAYPTCNGEWEFVGMHQASPDTYMAYCLHDPCPLLTDTDVVFVSNGSTVNFTLDAGPAYAFQPYLLLGSMSGWYPGTPIPWASCPLRINWDGFTSVNVALLNTVIFSNFLGTLDFAGMANAAFNLPPNSGMPPDFKIHFAYLLGAPNDYVSNPVEIWTRL